MKHVAIVVENLPAGADTRLRKQVRDLLAAGHRVSIITQRGPDNDPYRSIERLRLVEYPPPSEPQGAAGYVREYALSFSWALLRYVRLRLRGRVDVLQLCQPPDVYFPLAWFARGLGARVVVDQRDLMPELFVSRYPHAPAGLRTVLHWLERRTHRAADHTLVVNDYLRERVIGAGARRVSVVRNGPVLARVDRIGADPSWRRHRHLVCWIGKMGRQDRTDDVLEVADLVVHDLGRTDCGFAVLGDGECLDELRTLRRERDLEDWVALPGWLPEDDVFGALAAADVGIDTSLQEEVSPVKAMEYLAFGLPVVAYDLLETRRTLGDAGLLVPGGDAVAFAKQLVALLDDPTEMNRLGVLGRRRVEEQLAWERQRATYLRVIE